MGTVNAVGLVVSHCVALLSEPDRALRVLMHGTLATAGYDVFESISALQLEVGLSARPVFGASNVLLILGARFATDCALSIAAAARERARLGLSRAQLVLTYELGTLPTLARPKLAPCVTRGVLEKPFDLQDLKALALVCRHFPAASGANGASA